LSDSCIRYEGTLESFFFDKLEDAQAGERQLSDEMEAYVVHMLACFAQRPEVAGRTSEPLALQYLSAREHGPPALREVGDRALYIAGVIPRSLERSPVSVGYVTGIGSAAYREVHARVGRLTVFAQLAERFESVAELVGRAVGERDEDDLLALYERWRRRGASTDAKRLADRGVLLDPDRSDILQ
jgi:hypothetical protein